MKRKITRLRQRFDALEAESAEMQAEVSEKLMAVIGGLVVLWAHVENAIDAWVEVIHRTGGAEEIQTHLPPSLDREMDYLKTAWKTTKVSQSLKDEGLELMAEIHRLKRFRHDLVHGLADLNAPEALVVTLWKTKGPERIEIQTPYSMDQIGKMAADIVALKRRLGDFALRFAQATVDIVKGTS